MSNRDGTPLTAEQANAIFDTLVTYAGAREDNRDYFVSIQTREHLTEYRFGGSLGFGGKVWRNTGHRPDGTWGECWYVSAYPEDIGRSPDMRPAIDATNTALAALLTRFPDIR